MNKELDLTDLESVEEQCRRVADWLSRHVELHVIRVTVSDYEGVTVQVFGGDSWSAVDGWLPVEAGEGLYEAMVDGVRVWCVNPVEVPASVEAVL